MNKTICIAFALVCTAVVTAFIGNDRSIGADEKKIVEFIFDDYAVSVKYGSVTEYEKTVHYKDCSDLTIYYNATLGIAESCELKSVEMDKDKDVLMLCAKLKLPNGTVTFCEWTIGKFTDPNAEKKRSKPNVRIYLADPPRKIILVPKGKPK